MGKKIFEVYLAKEDVPNNEAYAKLDLPASLWELWDALDKVRLQTDDILYMEIEYYFAFEYLSPHLDGLDISLNELNDLAAQLAALDEVQEVAFDGFLRMEVQNKVDTNGGVITLQDQHTDAAQRAQNERLRHAASHGKGNIDIGCNSLDKLGEGLPFFMAGGDVKKH